VHLATVDEAPHRQAHYQPPVFHTTDQSRAACRVSPGDFMRQMWRSYDCYATLLIKDVVYWRLNIFSSADVNPKIRREKSA
jgi:hypothetical protein